MHTRSVRDKIRQASEIKTTPQLWIENVYCDITRTPLVDATGILRITTIEVVN